MPSQEPDDDEYEVESIRSAKVVRKRRNELAWFYQVKWKGYKSSENTWEPKESFENGANHFISRFWDRVDLGGRDPGDFTQFALAEEVFPVGLPRVRRRARKLKRKAEALARTGLENQCPTPDVRVTSDAKSSGNSAKRVFGRPLEKYRDINKRRRDSVAAIGVSGMRQTRSRDLGTPKGVEMSLPNRTNDKTSRCTKRQRRTPVSSANREGLEIPASGAAEDPKTQGSAPRPVDDTLDEYMDSILAYPESDGALSELEAILSQTDAGVTREDIEGEDPPVRTPVKAD